MKPDYLFTINDLPGVEGVRAPLRSRSLGISGLMNFRRK